MDVYDRIDKLLKERGMSRRKLAQLINIPATTLNSAFSRKNKRMSSDTLQSIADVLEVPIGELLYDGVIVINTNSDDITWSELAAKLDEIEMRKQLGIIEEDFQQIKCELDYYRNVKYADLTILEQSKYNQLLERLEELLQAAIQIRQTAIEKGDDNGET